MKKDEGTVLKVVDLAAGLGGRSLGFQKEGFEIVYASVENEESVELYSQLCKNNNCIQKHLQDIKIEEIPDTDVIIAPLKSEVVFRTIASRGPKVVVKKNNTNEIVYNIIKNKRPQIFLLEAPLSVLNEKNRNFSETILERYVSLGYDVSYNVFKESDYSGYPVDSKELFFVGVYKELGTYAFPKQRYKEYRYDFLCEDEEQIMPWYRKLKIEIVENNEGDFYEKQGKKVSSTNILKKNFYIENCRRDSLGIRRFTHNEMASLKGLVGVNYNECSNKRDMYISISFAANVFVVSAIAKEIHNLLEHHDAKEIMTKSLNEKKESKSKGKNKLVFPKHRIQNIHIDQLKGLRNMDINIDKNLVAIMGINGSGKSTILHALACTCTPYNGGDDYKFSFFFTPNPNASWKNSCFSIKYYDENEKKEIVREYKKQVDRWAPRYDQRPIRDVFYMGIETCIPEIELERKTSFIDYITNDAVGRNVENIIKDAAYILNKDYEKLVLHKTKRKELFGVHTSSGLDYSSLSMGAGEQRVIKILQKVYSINEYSLLLIDEIELLLHVSALKRLVQRLSEIAKKRNLQIIFTSHSLEMVSMRDFVDVKYLISAPEKTLVYNRINADLIYELDEENRKMLHVYVEDKLAESVIRCVIKNLNIQKYVSIKKIGSSENAFTIAASYILKEENYQNVLIILDGDVYREKSEKVSKIKNVLSGTEIDHDEKIENAVSIINELVLPIGIQPEKHIYDMLVEMDEDLEIVKCAKRINAVRDSHQWLDKIVDELQQSEDIILYQIIELVSEHHGWSDYVKNVREWFINKREMLNL